MDKKVATVIDKKFFWHKASDNSKECPERLMFIYDNLEKFGYLDKLIVLPSKEASDEKICSVHSNLYLNQIKKFALSQNLYAYDKDTYLNEDSPFVAKLAAGSCCTLADAIMQNTIQRAFALVRPPGHHSEMGRGSGFCIFNNVAITAKHLIDTYDLNRILIIDFDVHHSNGTQDIFYDSSKVFVLSVHQADIYPFTGKSAETGTGYGKGYNINLPVPSQFGDIEYSYILGNVVQDVIQSYLPQIIIVSAGFDGHINDPISKTCLSSRGYGLIANALRSFADKYSDGKLLYVLEGGYNIPSLWSSVKVSLDMLLKDKPDEISFNYSERAKNIIDKELPQEIRQKWLVY